jgi:hypothetical protein
MFSNNATSCCNRIIPSVSIVIAQSMGLHKNIASIHGNMLEQAVYWIKTQLGVRTGFYSHSPSWPVNRTGQGSCASPPVWLLNCSAYFKIYTSKYHGACYSSMDGKRETKLGMSGFVDDNNCNVNFADQKRKSGYVFVPSTTHSFGMTFCGAVVGPWNTPNVPTSTSRPISLHPASLSSAGDPWQANLDPQ